MLLDSIFWWDISAFSGGSTVLFVAINIPIPFKALMYGTVSPVSSQVFT
jgi:hypothetical protein